MKVGQLDEFGYRYLGNFSSAPDWASIGLQCDDCKVYWVGCAAAAECPECGDHKNYWRGEDKGAKDLEEAFDIIADKLVKADAEIEKLKESLRLKADVEYWHYIATVEKNGLITELCDALEDCGTKPYIDLKQRAREATR